MKPPPHVPAHDESAGTPRTRRKLVLIPLAALIAVLPLIRHGCSCGHDFDFHLLSWMEAARQFSHGNLHPQWAFTPAFNAGEPRFVFYPPLSWYLGALLGLLLTHLPGVAEAAAWSAAPILFTWIALALSGLAFHRLARRYVDANMAILAATLYLANPYMLFTAYERTAYGELLAAAWIPLLLASILRDRVSIPRIAVPIALLWLTDAPAAVMGSYCLAALAAVRVLSAYRKEATPNEPSSALDAPTRSDSAKWFSRHRSSLQLALRAAAGTALGLALAAFYIVPAAYERRFVQIGMAMVAGMSIDRNFLFERTGTSSDALLHDQVLHTASLIAILLLAATAAALAATLIRKPKPRFPALPLAMLTAGIALLLTPLSLPLWRHAPQAMFLQFPWRLLALLAPITALALAVAWNRFVLKLIPTAIVAILLAFALSYPAYRLFRQPCDLEDTAPARLTLFRSHSGTDPTDEYTPITADNDALHPNDPPYWLAASPTDPPPADQEAGGAPMRLVLDSPRAEDLILNLRNYPAWRISRRGQDMQAADILQRFPRADGLIAVPIPAGLSTIDIRYVRTADRTTGDAITLAALALLLLAFRRSSNRSAS